MLDQSSREFTTRKGTPIEFEVTYLPYRKSRKLLVELLRTFGQSIGILIDSAGGFDAKASMQALLVQKNQGNLFERIGHAFVSELSDEKLETVMAMLRDVTRVKQNGTWIDLNKAHDIVFLGEPLLLIRWLAFAIEVQYGDFFALRDALGQAASSGAVSAPRE